MDFSLKTATAPVSTSKIPGQTESQKKESVSQRIHHGSLYLWNI